MLGCAFATRLVQREKAREREARENEARENERDEESDWGLFVSPESRDDVAGTAQRSKASPKLVSSHGFRLGTFFCAPPGPRRGRQWVPRVDGAGQRCSASCGCCTSARPRGRASPSARRSSSSWRRGRTRAPPRWTGRRDWGLAAACSSRPWTSSRSTRPRRTSSSSNSRTASPCAPSAARPSSPRSRPRPTTERRQPTRSSSRGPPTAACPASSTASTTKKPSSPGA